jgi:nitroreductase
VTNYQDYAVRYVQPVDDILVDRYGTDHGLTYTESSIINHIMMHRTIRDFTHEEVLESDITAAIAAAQSAATSSHLQSWSVIRISDRQHKSAVNRLCGNQGQIDTAPLMLVWLADQSRNYAISKGKGSSHDAFDYFETSMLGIIDASMAAQNAALAFEALGYGTCFIGAVRNNAERLASLLKLPDRCIPVAGLVIGRPAPRSGTDIKPRLPQRVVVHEETYRAAHRDEISAYDQVMKRFQSKQWMASVNWSSKVAVRLSTKASLDGRDSYMTFMRSANAGVL